MKRREESTRKVRSDKKKDVQPVVSGELKKQLFRFAFLCREPMKDAGERLCAIGSTSPIIMDEINCYFRRNIRIDNHQYIGYLDRPRLQILQSKPEKITIKFPQESFEKLLNVSFALDLPLNQTAAVLLKKTITNQQFMKEYLEYHLPHLTDKERVDAQTYLKGVWQLK
ncbi:MAG: hypothetical protein R3328_00115 [Planococcaceae bacterium]|nr:hypothetical protein [Planococcaceae bacterium]